MSDFFFLNLKFRTKLIIPNKWTTKLNKKFYEKKNDEKIDNIESKKKPISPW